MSTLDIEQLLADAREREAVRCPHCSEIIDMTDSDRCRRHVTYWGEADPVEEDCPHCDKTLFLKEHITRRWSAAKTLKEALKP